MPGDFIVCDEIVCDLNTLTIPVVKGEMDGYAFQCVHIDHRYNILYLGDIAELEVNSLPEGFNGIFAPWYITVNKGTF